MFDSLYERYEKLTKSLYMDYDGQRKAEFWFTRIVILSGIIGLGIGYHYQKFSYTIYTLCVGFFIAALVTIPPWPMYRRKPLPWQRHNPSIIQASASTHSSSSRSSSSGPSSPTEKTHGRRGKGKKAKD